MKCLISLQLINPVSLKRDKCYRNMSFRFLMGSHFLLVAPVALLCNRFKKKKIEGKDSIELFRKNLKEIDIFHIPVLFLSVLFITPYCLLLY